MYSYKNCCFKYTFIYDKCQTVNFYVEIKLLFFLQFRPIYAIINAIKYQSRFRNTHVIPMILGEIKRYLRDGNSLRVSRSIRDTAYQILKVREKLERADEDVTYDKIAREMNIAVSEVAYALDAISDPVSLYEPVYNKSGDTLLLMDQIFDAKNNDEVWTEKAALYEAINRLEQREKTILFLRYFEGKTQTEISSEVGISQAQVSRLEKTALKRLKTCIS